MRTRLSRLARALALSAALLGFSSTASAADTNTDRPELIVKFKATATDAEIQHGMQQSHLHVKKHLHTAAMKQQGHNGVHVVDTDLDPDAAVEQLKKHPAVDYVERNQHYKKNVTSTDPYFVYNYNWGLYSAASSPTNTYGSGAADAWASGYTGTNSVYVAVIDEGTDKSHPDLASNMWINPYDPPDGIDNDGNGYVDDLNGWNFYANNNQIFDPTTDDHGTHVSGTIGAKGANGVGTAGVNWNVTILSGKFLGPNGGDTVSATEAIDYFVDMKKRHGMNIVAINASWGGGGYSQTLHDAMIRAAKAGILFIAAAGNDSLNNDTTADYPANIDTRVGTSTESAATFDGVIAVAAIDSTGALASFSNYGANKVHIGAPGVQILSTLPNNQYGYMSGTSMATPHVTGSVALYAASHPGATASSIRDAIIASATPTASLTGKTTSGARLNISKVIAPSSPAVPSGVSATARSAAVNLKWNAVSGATSYAVKRSTTSGGAYTQIATATTAAYTDATVSNGTTYYYVVSAANTVGSSANSSQVSATPQAVVASPTGVTGSAAQSVVAGTSAVTIKWTAITGARSYKVKRATSPTGTYTVVASSLTALSYTDTVTSSSGNVYYYRVVANNGTTDSADSATATVTTVAPTPVNLSGSATSSSQLQLKWTDRSADELGFKIEYWNGASWVQIGIVGANVSSVTITGTSALSTYYFRIRAYNSTTNTAYSNTATVTTP